MWMHGGALILGNRKGIVRPFHAGLLEQGYVIVSIGYRLAPETKLPAIIGDVQDAWKWMREQAQRFGIDRDRIANRRSVGGRLPGPDDRVLPQPAPARAGLLLRLRRHCRAVVFATR
jgi:acetyl esterase/lipase